MKSNVVLLAVFSLFLFGSVEAEESVYSSANRKLFWLPQSAGCAYADLAFAKDAAPNSNPAVMGFEESTSLSLGYLGLPGKSGSASTLAYTSSIPKGGSFGISLNYLLVSDIELTAALPLDNAGNPIKDDGYLQYGKASEFLFHAAYSHPLFTTDKFDIAAGLSINATRKMLPDTGSNHLAGYGLGADAGVAARFNSLGVHLSMLVENITTNQYYWNPNYSEQQNPHVRLGLGWQRAVPYLGGSVRLMYTTPDLLANEGINRSDSWIGADSAARAQQLTLSKNPELFFMGNVGGEVLFAQRVAIRLGMEQMNRLAFGAGLLLWQQRLSADVAYLFHELNGSYAASLSYRWP